MKNKSFLLIGMGSFGRHLCECLNRQGAEVMAVDRDAAKVEGVLPLVTSGKIGDCTNPEVLRSFGIPDFDVCFVCIEDNFQSSLVITDQLKELGAKKVFSLADKDLQEKFLRRNGADRVIFPEKDVAYRLAVSECSDTIFDFLALAGDYGIFEISPPADWIGQTVQQLDIRARYRVNILASRRGKQFQPIMSPEYRFSADEHVLLMGHVGDVRRLGG